MIYRPRRIVSSIREMVEYLPVIVVTGARQVGKSTMLKEEFADYDYLTLDDYALLEQAKKDPQSLWTGKQKVIIDEAQKVPSIFSAIKLAVDESNRARRFIISGSANLYLMEKVTESLAGRALYIDLLPMTFGECRMATMPINFTALWSENLEPEQPNPPPDTDLIEIMLKGFMPPVMEIPMHRNVLNWLDGYVKTYLERDLRELSQVESLIDFRKVMQSIALRTGNILNQADVAKVCGVSHPTAHRYVKLLEVSNIINRVPAYYASRSKRLVKSPKVFFLDPGLSIFLSSYTDRAGLESSRELGGFFETLVYLHLKSHCELMSPQAKLYYWRTTAKKEVDFVIEHGRQILPIEVKLSKKPTIHDAASLLDFIDEHPQAMRGVVIHGGNDVYWLHSKVIAVPWWWLEA